MRKSKTRRRKAVTLRGLQWAFAKGRITIACPAGLEVPCPCLSAPKLLGLNNLFRGGAGGARATSRHRNQAAESELLGGLQALLEKFAPNHPSPERPVKKAKMHSSPEGAHAQGLLPALQQLVQKAEKEPKGLLESLRELVARYAQADNGLPQSSLKRMRWADGEDQAQASQPPPKKGKGKGSLPPGKSGGKHPANQSPPNPKGKGQGPTKGGAPTNGPDQPTSWASVVANGVPTPRTAQPTSSKPVATEPRKKTAVLNVQLHRHVFPAGAITPVAEAREALEQGKAPTGNVILCNPTAVQDLRRLASLHQLTDAKVALLTPHVPDDSAPPHSNAMWLPTWEGGKPNVRQFWVSPLVKDLPTLPEQKLKQTKVRIDSEPLLTFRATIASNLCSRDCWDSCKRNPPAHIYGTFDKGVVHSTFGWREISVPAKKEGVSETFLQGFIRTKKQFATKMDSHVGSDGLFIERLASDPTPRRSVWWVPRHEGELPLDYHARALTEARNQNATLAHRRGGGAFLGLRLGQGKAKAQLRAWSLHNAPKSWNAQEVIQCVLDSGASDVEVVRPPGRQRSWLLKAVVPDEDDLGVVAIQANDRTLLLNRQQNKAKRTVQVVSVIRTPKHKVPECQILLQNPEPVARSNANTSGGTAEVAAAEGRGRSRSPARGETTKTEPAFPYADKFEALDCGGGGDCGYLCLAAGMGFDKGEPWEDLQSKLLTRSRTIRNDLYKHMSSSRHEAEYKAYFTPQLAGSEAQEAGEVPTDWNSWLESTLRPHRWIDGLSIAAACRRYGLHIIIVPSTSDPKNLPMVMGQPRSGRPPIVLLLHDGHYQLARLKVGKQWPKAFLEAEEGRVSSKIFRGGGKAASVKSHSRTNSESDWRPVRTPESRSNASWRPQHTPTASQTSRRNSQAAASTKHHWRQPHTPETKAKINAQQLSSCASVKASILTADRSRSLRGLTAKSKQRGPARQGARISPLTSTLGHVICAKKFCVETITKQFRRPVYGMLKRFTSSSKSRSINFCVSRSKLLSPVQIFLWISDPGHVLNATKGSLGFHQKL